MVNHCSTDRLFFMCCLLASDKKTFPVLACLLGVFLHRPKFIGKCTTELYPSSAFRGIFLLESVAYLAHSHTGLEYVW